METIHKNETIEAKQDMYILTFDKSRKHMILFLDERCKECIVYPGCARFMGELARTVQRVFGDHMPTSIEIMQDGAGVWYSQLHRYEVDIETTDIYIANI